MIPDTRLVDAESEKIFAGYNNGLNIQKWIFNRTTGGSCILIQEFCSRGMKRESVVQWVLWLPLMAQIQSSFTGFCVPCLPCSWFQTHSCLYPLRSLGVLTLSWCTWLLPHCLYSENKHSGLLCCCNVTASWRELTKNKKLPSHWIPNYIRPKG